MPINMLTGYESSDIHIVNPVRILEDVPPDSTDEDSRNNPDVIKSEAQYLYLVSWYMLTHQVSRREAAIQIRRSLRKALVKLERIDEFPDIDFGPENNNIVLFNKNSLNNIDYNDKIYRSTTRKQRVREQERLEPMDEKNREKRIYRKSDARPRPELPGNAEPNRLKQQFKLRLDPQLIERVSAQAAKSGKTRQDWVTDVLEAALDG